MASSFSSSSAGFCFNWYCCLWVWVVVFSGCWINQSLCQNAKSVEVSVNGTSAIAETDVDFICATLDWWPPEKCDYGTCSWGMASLLNLNLESSLLTNAVKAFKPLKIRLGGTLQDKVIYDVGNLKKPCKPFVSNASLMFGFTDGCLPMSRWDALNLFFKKTGAVVAFGLNALNGRYEAPNGAMEGAWDSSNAYDFIKYTVDHGYQISAWEFGNELSGSGVGTSISAKQYAADVIKLNGIVKDIYKDFQLKPLIVAPDGFFDVKWFTEFLQQTGPNVVNAITHHIYNLGPGVDAHLVEKILDPSYLSNEEPTFNSLETLIKKYGPWSSAWVGEAGGAYNSGHNLVTNAFVFSFWYLDQLGMASKFNTKCYCRQSLIGGNYGLLNTTTYAPNPDYYSALLWHRLMGTQVLSVSSKGTDYLRAYAHCTKNATGVTLLLINLSKTDHITVGVTTYSNLTKKMNTSINISQRGEQNHINSRAELIKGNIASRLEYHLTAKDGNLQSQTMILNGKILDITADGEMPSLDPIKVNFQSPISVAPLSIAFVILPVQLPACRS